MPKSISDTVIARRDKTQEAARSVIGEFVSGNYFRTFGLQSTVGRLFTNAMTNPAIIVIHSILLMTTTTLDLALSGTRAVLGPPRWTTERQPDEFKM